MSRKQLGTICVTLLVLFAFPGTGHASIIDWIWSMSGPQLFGVVLHCEYDVQNNQSECRGLDLPPFVGKLAPRQDRRVWLSLDTGLYTSTGRDSGGVNFKKFKNNMVAFEPMLEYRSYTSADPDKRVTYSHGLIGISWQYLFGNHPGFDKFALKFRPFGITINHKLNFTYNLRLYPHGFTPDEFAATDPTTGLPFPRLNNVDRPAEVVHGFSVGYLWKGR